MKGGNKALTLVELLVVMVISLMVMGAVYASLSMFLKKTSTSEKKIREEEEIRLALSLLEDDIRHSGFGYLKEENGTCLLAVDDNCGGPDKFCEPGTDRLFVADGWRMIREFTEDHCPDGNVPDDVYEALAGSAFAGNVTSISGDTVIVENLNVNGRNLRGGGLCGDDDDDGSDFSGNGAAIMCGCDDNSTYGRRISSIDNSTPQIDLLSNEEDITANCSKMVPAIIWYVRKPDDDNDFWLYRNESRVLKGIKDFQVKIGYDSNKKRFDRCR